MVIRDLEKKDIDKVIELRLQNAKIHLEFSENASLRVNEYFKKHTKSAYENDNSKLLVVEIENTIVAYAITFINRQHPIFDFGNEAQIEDIFVSSKYQNRKIGSLLLKELEAYFKSKQIDKIGLSVYTQNIKGQKFWSKHAYQCEYYKMFKNI